MQAKWTELCVAFLILQCPICSYWLSRKFTSLNYYTRIYYAGNYVLTRNVLLIKQAYLNLEEKNSCSTFTSRSRPDAYRHWAGGVAWHGWKLESNFSRTINSNLTLSHSPSSLQATSNFPLNSNSLARLLASLVWTSNSMRNDIRELGEDLWLAFALLKLRLWIV
jgi:hypothetical protein